MKKIRIAFILDIFPCVSETFILNQIIDLIKRGHHVDIYANYADSSTIHEKFYEFRLNQITNYSSNPPLGSKKILYALGLLFSSIRNFLILVKSLNVFEYGKDAIKLNSLFRYARFANKPTYDIIHAHFGHMGIYALEMKEFGWFKSSKIITTFHGHDINPKQIKHNTFIYKNLFEKCDFFTVNSNFTFNLLLKSGCSKEKIMKLPVGLDTVYYQRKKEPDLNAKLKIVFCGRFVAFKGPDLFVRIALELVENRTFKNVEFHMIGDGPMGEYIRGKVKEWKLSSYFFFYGSNTQQEIIKIFSEMDLFLYPGIFDEETGRVENQGLVLQEAQALRLPVITSKVGGIPEGILDEKTGFLVEEGDIITFTDRIVLLASNKELRKEMGRFARAYVVDNFDIEILGKQLEDKYYSLIT